MMGSACIMCPPEGQRSRPLPWPSMILAVRADLQRSGIAPALGVMWKMSWPCRCAWLVQRWVVWLGAVCPNDGCGVRH